MTDPTPLSTAAQAVMNALWDADLDYCQSIEDIRRRQAAAALRALTKTSLVEEALICGWFCSAIRTDDILAIAAELENHQ